MMYASILRYHFEKQDKTPVYKEPSLVTPELIPGVALEFEIEMRGHAIFICYKIWSKKGQRMLTLEVF